MSLCAPPARPPVRGPTAASRDVHPKGVHDAAPGDRGLGFGDPHVGRLHGGELGQKTLCNIMCKSLDQVAGRSLHNSFHFDVHLPIVDRLIQIIGFA
eukprot:CAMPEP_0174348240 /NCGR_PEP_ID=MMETSP0811_2-20130205/4627_1 /TAXON_ID=73025 ORGANISM="Eutreptiella gymnastica-like, Strain CCMP1594" /NCGR_SAMPLE_ID=MMETSP0811_2 /ASSEMBLY_ACC=CAM_ASM_000667 /LENGTH=96 /DNA_ID=CAMNT_0015474599 /DNA_START=1187 /DNA_END=1478 /DNA_ORIENTATION=+